MPLLERHRESAEIACAIDDACAGRGALVLIEGSAGIGKTRLLEEVRDLAREQGMGVLHAVADLSEREFPCGVIRQLLRRSAEEMLAERGGRFSAVTPALPALGLDQNRSRFAVEPDPFAVVNGLYWLCATLGARGPTALVVDDMQWADGPSWRFLVYLARRMQDLPVLMVLALRTGEELEHQELAATLTALPFSRELRPAPLTSEAVARLLEEALGQCDEDLVTACVTATGGNPFLVHEVLRAVDASRPDWAEQLSVVLAAAPLPLVRSVEARLASLPSGAAELARAVAVLGIDARLSDAARLAGLDLRRAAQVLDALVAADILTADTCLGFVHPLIREAVSATMGPGARSVAHADAARLLAEQGAPPERVAAHLLETAPDRCAWTVKKLREASDQALTSGAAAIAVSFLRRALAEPPDVSERPAVLFELGRAEARADDSGAEAHLRQALAGLSDPPQRGAVVLELARLRFLTGHHVEAVELLASAIEGLWEIEPELAGLLESQLLNAARLDLTVRSLVKERIGRLSPGIPGAPPEFRLAQLATEAAMVGEPAPHALSLAQEALASGRLVEQAVDGVLDVFLAARVLALGDHLKLAHSVMTEVLQRANERGASSVGLMALIFRSEVAYRAGAIDEALADTDIALRLVEELPNFVGLPLLVSFALEALVDRGELEEASALLERFGLTGQLHHAYPCNPLLWSRGGLRLARGDPAGALDDVLESGRREEAWGERNPAVVPWRSRGALALTALGMAGEGRRLAAEELELARRFGTPRAIGIALRALALVAEEEERLELLAQAVDSLAASVARLEHARALVDLGAALRAAGKRTAATEHLRDGLDRAHRCGATAVVARARDELLAAGVRPRRVVLCGSEALTPSEARIARLAATGASNAHIAQQLFVTVRTVEAHLSHAYQKLGIAGRSQLRAALGDAASRAVSDPGLETAN